MNQRACVKCNTRWTIDASTCPFCGGDSTSVNVPPPAWEQAVRTASAPNVTPAAESAESYVPPTPSPMPAVRPPVTGAWGRFRRWLGGRRGATSSNRRA